MKRWLMLVKGRSTQIPKTELSKSSLPYRDLTSSAVMIASPLKRNHQRELDEAELFGPIPLSSPFL